MLRPIKGDVVYGTDEWGLWAVSGGGQFLVAVIRHISIWVWLRISCCQYGSIKMCLLLAIFSIDSVKTYDLCHIFWIIFGRSLSFLILSWMIGFSRKCVLPGGMRSNASLPKICHSVAGFVWIRATPRVNDCRINPLKKWIMLFECQYLTSIPSIPSIIDMVTICDSCPSMSFESKDIDVCDPDCSFARSREWNFGSRRKIHSWSFGPPWAKMRAPCGRGGIWKLVMLFRIRRW